MVKRKRRVKNRKRGRESAGLRGFNDLRRGCGDLGSWALVHQVDLSIQKFAKMQSTMSQVARKDSAKILIVNEVGRARGLQQTNE